jgi:ankyrin repeat protein
MLGTPGFLAPELLGILPQRFRSKGSNSYTKAVDIWALGCLVYNMLTLEAPFLASTSIEEQSTISIGLGDVHGYCQRELDYGLLYNYCDGGNHVITDSFRKLGVAESEIMFVNRLLVVDLKSRISAAAALMDPWFLQVLYTLDSPRNDRNIGLRDHDSWFLIESAKYGRLDLVYTFLAAGADVRWVDDNGNTALHLAAMNRHHDVVKVLLERGADMDEENDCGQTPLHLAVLSGREAINIVQLLLERGADLSAADLQRRTPLHLAASRSHGDVVRLLLEKGADLSAVDQKGKTPLYSAAQAGYEGIVRLLLENGADLSAADSAGYTPLHRAAWLGHEDIVQLLLEKGADLNAAGSGGDTPLHRAAFRGHKDIVRLLLEKGADVRAVDNVRCTALHRACLEGHVAIVRILLENGADVCAVDSEGDSPLDHTLDVDCKELLRHALVTKGEAQDR